MVVSIAKHLGLLTTAAAAVLSCVYLAGCGRNGTGNRLQTDETKLAPFGIRSVQAPERRGGLWTGKSESWLFSEAASWDGLSLVGYSQRGDWGGNRPHGFEPVEPITRPEGTLLVLQREELVIDGVDVHLVVGVNRDAPKDPAYKRGRRAGAFFHPQYPLKMENRRLIRDKSRRRREVEFGTFVTSIIVRAWYYPGLHDLGAEHEIVRLEPAESDEIEVGPDYSVAVDDLLREIDSGRLVQTSTSIASIRELLAGTTWRRNPRGDDPRHNPRAAAVLDARRAYESDTPWIYFNDLSGGAYLNKYCTADGLYCDFGDDFVVTNSPLPDPETALPRRRAAKAPFEDLVCGGRAAYARHFNRAMRELVRKHGEPPNSTRQQWLLEPEVHARCKELEWLRLAKVPSLDPGASRPLKARGPGWPGAVVAYTHEQQVGRGARLSGGNELTVYAQLGPEGAEREAFLFQDIARWVEAHEYTYLGNFVVARRTPKGRITTYDMRSGTLLPLLREVKSPPRVVSEPKPLKGE